MRRSTWTCSATAATRPSPGTAASARSGTTIDRPKRRSLMSAVAIPPVRPGDNRNSSASPAPTAVAFHYTQTESFVALLQQLGASLLVSTYQANKLLVARAVGGGL